MEFWKTYDKYMMHTTALAIVIAFGMNLPHIAWLDWMAYSGEIIFDKHSEIDAFMVAVEHIELVPLLKLGVDAWRKWGKH